MRGQLNATVECDYLEEFVDQAIPGPGAERLVDTATRGGRRALNGAAPSGLTRRLSREAWVEVLQQQTTPAEGSTRRRLAARQAVQGQVVISLRPPKGSERASADQVEGEEVDLDSEHFLVLHHRGPGEQESTTYIPWRDIHYIQFRWQPHQS